MKASAVAHHNSGLAVVKLLNKSQGKPTRTAPLMLNSNAKYASRQYMHEVYMWHSIKDGEKAAHRHGHFLLPCLHKLSSEMGQMKVASEVHEPPDDLQVPIHLVG